VLKLVKEPKQNDTNYHLNTQQKLRYILNHKLIITNDDKPTHPKPKN